MTATVTADDLIAHAVREMRAVGLPTTGRLDPVPFRVGDFNAHVRPMSPVERARLYAWTLAVGHDHPDRLLVLAVLTICDQDGDLKYDLDDLPLVREEIHGATVAAVAAWQIRASRL